MREIRRGIRGETEGAKINQTSGGATLLTGHFSTCATADTSTGDTAASTGVDCRSMGGPTAAFGFRFSSVTEASSFAS